MCTVSTPPAKEAVPRRGGHQAGVGQGHLPGSPHLPHLSCSGSGPMSQNSLSVALLLLCPRSSVFFLVIKVSEINAPCTM